MFHVSASTRRKDHAATAISEVDSYAVRQLAGIAELVDIARAQLLWADTADIVMPLDLVQVA